MRGQRKRPLPRQKAPGRKASEGPCDPQADKICRQNPQKGGVHSPRPRQGIPWPSLGRGVGKTTLSPTSVRLPTQASRNVWSQNKTEGEKNKPSTRSTEHPCRLASQEKGGLRASTRRIPKTPGAQKGTPAKRQEAGRTAKTGKTDKRGGTQKRKRTRKTSACAGVSCYYLSYVS